MGDAENLNKESLQEFIDNVANRSIKVNLDGTFSIEEIAVAYQYMESNLAKGKVVVVI